MGAEMRHIVTEVVYRPITIAQAIDAYTSKVLWRDKQFPKILKAEWQKNMFSEYDDVLITAQLK